MAHPSAEGPASARPVLIVWALVGTLISLPYVLAVATPPEGGTFAGTFHWIDDFHNYVSFVQQAEEGRVLFENKLLLEKHDGVLVNLEWWLVGALSRLCGRRPFLAYRLLALLALAGLLFAADRGLRRLGLPSSHRVPALLLVSFGGGLGGLLFELTHREVFRCADLAIAFFPFLEALANPHWLTATWLAMETLLAYSSGRRFPDGWRGAAFGTALGLVRPYDLVLIVLVIAVSAVATRPREWLRRGLPLVGLAPVLAYNYWVFYRSGVFPTYTVTPYASPPLADFGWALGPALLVALLSLHRPLADPTLGRHFWIWTTAAVAVMILRPAPFALQFTIGCGLPLLILGALGLRRLRPVAALATAALLSTTSMVALWIVVTSRNEPWYVPAERRGAALALRPVCRPGDLVFAPPDIGLYAIALTSCRAYSSHTWEPDHDHRLAAVRAFYRTMAPAERAAHLDRVHIRHLVLPGDPGPAPDAWLGPSRFRRVARVGTGARMISAYTREP